MDRRSLPVGYRLLVPLVLVASASLLSSKSLHQFNTRSRAFSPKTPLAPTLCAHLNYYAEFAATIHYASDLRTWEKQLKDSADQIASSLGITSELSNETACKVLDALAATNPNKTKEDLYEQTFSQYLQNLDPHSFYASQAIEDEALKEESSDELDFGIRFYEKPFDTWVVPKSWRIKYVVPGSPADGKIKPASYVSKINGASLKGYSRSEVYEKLKNVPTISVELEGSNEMTVLTKSKIFSPTVFSKKISDTSNQAIGYLDIRSFKPNQTRQEAKDALFRLGTIDGLIVDVRMNQGGELESVLGVLGLFLGKTHAISARMKVASQLFLKNQYQAITPEDQSYIVTAYQTSGERLLLDVPVIVLIDYASFSGAEMLAGVLRDYGALAIGNTSYGKGTGQNWVVPTSTTLSQNAFKRHIVVTYMEYFTASGKAIQGTGIAPDVVIQDQIFDKLLQYQQSNTLYLREKDLPHALSSRSLSDRPLELKPLLKGKELILKPNIQHILEENIPKCGLETVDCELTVALSLLSAD